MKKFAELTVRFRAAILLIIGIVTVIWALQIPKLNISTSFEDLLPQTHPYIKIHKEFQQNFGGANQLIMLLQVKSGDIFSQATLRKIKYVTEELLTIPGVDRHKILSIAHQKFSTFKYTSWGIETNYLMWPEIPKTEQEMKKLKDSIFSNMMYYGTYVSYDCKSSLITADFYEEKLDYNMIYQRLSRIRKTVEDDQHMLCIVGYPMHLGVVSSMITEMNYIMGSTLLIIPLLLYLAYRSFWAVLIVPSSAVISGIWGLGFMAMMGYNLDPLVFVLPFLISLCAFRHCHQLYNRYYEEYVRTNDPMAGVRVIIEQMFLPGLIAVITDAFGIAIIAITPVPMLQRIAIAGTFWSIITVVVGLILTPVLLTYVPLSPKLVKRMERLRLQDEQRLGWENRFADWMGPWLIGKGRYIVMVIAIIVTCFSIYWSERLIVGDAQVGSNLLYPSSRYNQDSERINKTHPLINPLYIIVSGEQRYAIKTGRVIKDIHNFSRAMEKHSGAVGTQNIVQFILGMNQGMHADDPKWYGFPASEFEIIHLFQQLASGGDPGFVERFLDYHDQYTNIIVLFKDKTGPTIKKAIDTARSFINNQSVLETKDAVSYKLAGGVIGVEAAINEVVAEKQLETLIYALLGVFFFCALEFKSLKAGLILMIPVILSNWMAYAYMAINQIGLSISTLPVSAAGVGMGVDYGIYMLARVEEERANDPGISLETALLRTIQSYSKSIFAVAGTLFAGLLVWTLSGLKFQAQMGLMLAVILFLNCLGAIFLVPVLVLLFKPKFLTRTNTN